MSGEIASAYVSLYTKMPGLKSDVGKQLSGVMPAEGQRSGSLFAKGMKLALGGAAMVGAINVAKKGLKSIYDVTIGGGIARAMAIDEAQAKLTGLGHTSSDTSSIMNSAIEAVTGTSYALGDAASTAAALSASGVKSGGQMTNVLKTVADVSYISGKSFQDTGAIFTSAMSVIPADKWVQSAVDEVQLSGGKVFGVSFSRSGNRVALAGAGRTDAGVHVEVIDGLSGTIVDGVGQLADWLALRWGDTEKIMVAGSGAVLLQKALTDRGVPGRGVIVADTGVYVEACQAFLEGVRSGVVSHPCADSRRDMLEIAVRSAVQKRKGSAWGWGSTFKDGSEVPLEAVSLAYLGVKMAKARRRERSGRKRVSVV